MFFFMMLFQTTSFGQLQVKTAIDTPPIIKPYKRPFAAVAEVTAVNVIINRINVDIRNVDWAKVTWASWKKNVKTGFKTDFDHFATNWLGHPMHGSYSYNSARSNGYNYWQSIPFIVGGSLMWEYFGETYNASEIDLFTTTFGGVYLGEMTHRFAELIKYKVKNKILRHTAITLLNPMYEINSHLFENHDFMVASNKASKSPLLRGQFSFGGSYPLSLIKDNVYGTRSYLNLNLVYGDVFDLDNGKFRPFDHFVFRTWANFKIKGLDSAYLNITSYAPLLVKPLGENSLIGLSQHYDYMSSAVYKLGSLAVTGGYYYRHNWDNKYRMFSSLKAGVILFGSSKSDIVDFIYQSSDPDFERDYVYGNGLTGEAEMILRTEKFGRFLANWRRWFMYTKHDAKGTEDINYLLLEYNYPIWRKLNVGIQSNYYKRRANYPDYPTFQNIKKDYHEFKTLLTLMF